MIIETSRGRKGVSDPRIRIGTTPGGGFKAYLIVDNTESNRRMWAVAGPGATKNVAIRRQWAVWSIVDQPSAGYVTRAMAEEYRATLQGLGNLEQIVPLHTGLQENAFPTLVEND